MSKLCKTALPPPSVPLPPPRTFSARLSFVSFLLSLLCASLSSSVQNRVSGCVQECLWAKPCSHHIGSSMSGQIKIGFRVGASRNTENGRWPWKGVFAMLCLFQWLAGLAFAKMAQNVAFEAIASGGGGIRQQTIVTPQPCSWHDSFVCLCNSLQTGGSI